MEFLLFLSVGWVQEVMGEGVGGCVMNVILNLNSTGTGLSLAKIVNMSLLVKMFYFSCLLMRNNVFPLYLSFLSKLSIAVWL